MLHEVLKRQPAFEKNMASETALATASGTDLPSEKKHRGIPEATFVEDVDTFMSKQGSDSAESVLRQLDEQHQKYKFMEFNLLAKKRKLLNQIPDLKSTYEMIKVLQKKKKVNKTLSTQFLLSDQVFVNASVPPTDKVCLWLGANVMLEYTIDEAEKLISKSLESANKSLEGVAEDLDFLKDQYVTTEVKNAIRVIKNASNRTFRILSCDVTSSVRGGCENKKVLYFEDMARVYNWDVKRRQALKA